jgi:hypothetical protein
VGRLDATDGHAALTVTVALDPDVDVPDVALLDLAGIKRAVAAKGGVDLPLHGDAPSGYPDVDAVVPTGPPSLDGGVVGFDSRLLARADDIDRALGRTGPVRGWSIALHGPLGPSVRAPSSLVEYPGELRLRSVRLLVMPCRL